MLDIRFIRENAERVAEASRQKGYDVDIAQLLGFDSERRELQKELEKLRYDQNQAATAFSSGPPDEATRNAFRTQRQIIKDLEHKLNSIEQEYLTLLKKVPNLPEADVPVGASEDENVVAKTVGEKPAFEFEPKNHAEIAEAKGWLDKESAAKVAGSRFAYVQGDLVKLQLAIMQFVTDKLSDSSVLAAVAKEAGLVVSDKPFIPVLPPYMIRTELYDAMDRLEPSDDRYKIEGEELWLQGSAEHVLGSKHADEIFAEADLPVRYLGYATSFRKEAGTYGKDMEGLIRMHQFDKLEMESFSTKETSRDEHLFFIAIQEYLLRELKLPYQVLMKCTADIGKPNARGVDMEVWLPGQGKYRETHTADYMTDYQARRLNTRVRKMAPMGTAPMGQNHAVELIHTNDATAFALGRTMVAIIENYQTRDGDVLIPEVLRPYLGGREVI